MGPVAPRESALPSPVPGSAGEAPGGRAARARRRSGGGPADRVLRSGGCSAGCRPVAAGELLLSPCGALLPWWSGAWADNLGRGLPLLSATCGCVVGVGKGRLSVPRRAPRPVPKLPAEATLAVRQARVGSFLHSPG